MKKHLFQKTDPGATKAGWLKRMLANAAAQDKRLFVFCVLYTLVATAVPFFTVILPKYLVALITGPAASVEGVLHLVLIFLGAGSVFYFARQWLEDYAYPRMTRLRIGYVRDQAVKLVTMDYPYCEDAGFNDRYEKALESTSSNDNGVEGIYHKLFLLPAAVLSVVALAVFVGTKSFWILPALLVHVAVTVALSFALQKYQYSQKEELARHSRRVRYYTDTTQDFAYGKDLRLYGLRQRVLSNFKTEIRGYLQVFSLISKREFDLSLLSLVTLLISDAVTYGTLILLVVRGMSIADFSMMLVAVTSLSVGLTTLTDYITYIRREAMYVQDFYRFQDADLNPCGGTRAALPKDQTPEIEFRHVTFRYPGAAENVFTDFSLRIPAGQKLALVGINGAGKTTFVKLLTGLFKVDSGEILLNGHNVNEWPRNELWQMFGVVFQEVNILAFTIAENVACSLENVDRIRVEKVLRQVGLYEKVASFEKGIDQPMLEIIEEDGVLLSGGEMQKLAIARALYKQANVVIMDEPTAALDALAEAEIYSEFDTLTGGKTSVYISHRLASTKFCDAIALLDRDGLREYGTHDELMAQKGVYYEMFVTQGKYYRENEEEELLPKSDLPPCTANV